MNDLDLVRQMRADAPQMTAADLARGRERLHAALTSPTPSRRRLPRRPVLIAGGLAVATAAAGIVVATRMDDEPVTLKTAPAAKWAKYADPLVERAAFGWLPGGLRTNGYVADHQEQSYFQVTAQNGNRGPVVTLTAYAAGKEPVRPAQPGGIPSRRIPAEPVNGHSAYWIFTPDASGQSSFLLRWKYAPKTWADLEAVGLRGSDAELTAIAYRIARSATFGGNRPIAMPLHIGGVPGGMTPKRTVLNADAHGQVSAILDYIVDGPVSGLSVGIDNSSGFERIAVPNGTLDGHPAHRGPGALYVYGVNGFDVQILAEGPVLAKLDRTGGLTGLFRNIQILGPDPAKWTTNPVN